jgi:Xaa-Pro aminopeptidase
MQGRIERVRKAMEQAGIAGLLISSAANRRWVSGFSGSAGVVLIGQQTADLFTDGRYTEQAAAQAPACTIHEIRPARQPFAVQLAARIAELGLSVIGYEANALTVAEFGRWQAAVADGAWQPADELLEQLRVVKDAAELSLLRRAIVVTDQAISAVLPTLRADMSERELAWQLEVALRERGAEAVSFPIIVAAGPNAARAHHQPSDDLLGSGRPIVIDMGARVDGYHGDLTRTVTVGAADEQFNKIYDIVLAAQRAAIAGVRPGLNCGAADALARDVITAAGYGEYFSHSLGHGVGLQIHEAPWLRSGGAGELAAGMVTSIEPGIYLPGWGGVRIEDLILVTDDGHDVLSQAAKLR